MRTGSLRLFLLIGVVVTGGIVLQAETPQHQAWRILQSGAADKSPEVRMIAVAKLGLVLHDPMAAAIAEKALEDEVPEVRAAGARALGNMLYAPSIPKLRKALADEDSSVVIAAAHALVQFKDPAGFELYYSILTGERKDGQGFLSRELDILKDPTELAKFTLEEGIGFLPYGGYGLSAIQFIRQGERDESDAKAVAARVLAYDPDPQSGKALVRAVSDKSWVVREAALEAIAKRADPSLLGDIRAAMSDKYDHVRFTAAAAVIRLTDVSNARKGKK